MALPGDGDCGDWGEKKTGRSVSSKQMTAAWKIHGRTYDLTPLIRTHPGGSSIIKLTRGMDCTALFESYHVFSDAPREQLARYGPPYNDERTDPLHVTLRSDARSVFGTRLASKTPLSAFAFRVCVQAAAYALMITHRSTPSAVIHGIMVVVCYSRTFHDLSHYAVAIPPLACDIAGELLSLPYTQYPAWVIGHVIFHHQYTNGELDPDHRAGTICAPTLALGTLILAAALIRPMSVPWLSVQLFELTFYVACTWRKLGSYARARCVFTSVATFCFYIGMCNAIPAYEWLMFVTGIIFLPIFGGFSVLSHWPATTRTAPSTSTWAERQVHATENYEGASWLVRFLSTGLSNQIEHHLIPVASSGRVHKMRDRVKLRLGGAYRDNSIIVAIARMVRGFLVSLCPRAHAKRI